MRELAVQSASDGMNTDDRSSIDLEFQQLKAEITRISDATEYNGTKLLNENLKSTNDANISHVTISGDSVQAGTYSLKNDGSSKLTITTSDGRSQTVEVAASSVSSSGGTIEFGSLGLTISNASSAAIGAANIGTTSATDFTVSGGATIQVGANNVELEDQLKFSIGDHTADSTSGGLGISTVSLDSLAHA